MKIQEVTDAAFASYGRIVTGYHLGSLLDAMEETPCPENGTVYVPSEKALEETEAGREICKKSYGGMPVQIGYCNGVNHKLNAVEYHRSSEIDIAVNDLILLLGMRQDIVDGDTYDTANMEAFLLPAGTAVELYATTLHFAPCSVGSQGFRCVIVLPEGTNTELTYEPDRSGEDKLLTATNKWLIAHEEAGIEGAFVGLAGENITV